MASDIVVSDDEEGEDGDEDTARDDEQASEDVEAREALAKRIWRGTREALIG